MASPFSVFRKHQTVMLAGLTILAMFGFVFLPIILEGMGLRGVQDPLVVSCKYGKIHEYKLIHGMMPERRIIVSILQEMAGLLVQRNGNPSSLQDVITFLTPLTEESVVRTWVLARYAEELGLVVDNDTINHFLDQSVKQDRRIRSDDILRILKRYGDYSEHRFFQAVRDVLLAYRLQTMFQPALFTFTPAERWEYFNRLNRKATVEVVPVRVDRFVEQVPEPDEPQLRQFFDENKHRIGEPDSPLPGFSEPRRNRVRYFRADFSQFSQAVVSEEEILQEYQRTKETEDKLDREFPLFSQPSPTERDTKPTEKDTKDVTTEKTEQDQGAKEPQKGEEPRDATGKPAAPYETPAETGNATEKPKPKAGESEPDITEPTAGELAPEKPDTEKPEPNKPAFDKPNVDKPRPDSSFGELPAGESSSLAPMNVSFRWSSLRRIAADAPETTGATEGAGVGETGGASGKDKDAATEMGANKSGNEAVEGGPMLPQPKAADEPDATPKSQDEDGFEEKDKPKAIEPSDPKPADQPELPPEAKPETSEAKAILPEGTDKAAPKPDTPSSEGQSTLVPEPPQKPEERQPPGPSERAKQRIRHRLAMEKFKRFSKQLDQIVARHGTEMIRYQALRADHPNLKRPTSPDFAKLAAENHMTTDETGLMAPWDTVNYEIGRASVIALEMYEVGGLAEWQGEPFRRAVFTRDLGLYRPTFAFERVRENRILYLFWKTEEHKESIPSFEDAEVRRRVAAKWKEIEARLLARAAAKQLAEEAKAKALPLSVVFANRPDAPVAEAGPFSWLTIPPTSPGEALFRRSLPVISEVSGVEMAGEEFMRTVFSLVPGEVGVAMNKPQTVAYVIRLVESVPSFEKLWADFERDRDANYLVAAAEQRRELWKKWYAEIDALVGVKWERKPYAESEPELPP